MPFTIAHPAIVLPFLRSKYVSATGLIVGSMAPDFEYFITMNDKPVHGHTLMGVLYFDLPLTCLIAFLFHRYIKLRVISNLPPFFQRRLNEVNQFDFNGFIKTNWLIFILSAVAGSASHLIWDSFTHADTFIVRNFSVYDTIVPFRGARYPFYYFLQYISSYAGLIVLAVYLVRLKPDEITVVTKPAISYWLTLVIICLLVLFLRFYWNPESFNLVRGIITSISGLCVALLVTGLISANGNKSELKKY